MTSKVDMQCANSQRRADIRAREQNGIDYVEVSDDGLVLAVTFLAEAPAIVKEMVQITGGARVRNIVAVDLRPGSEEDEDLDDSLRIFVDKAGDLSTYTLSIVELDEQGQPTRQPFRELDVRYSKVDFNFHAGRASNIDCIERQPPPPQDASSPKINYLAKDFSSFRQLMLDRLALTLPQWTERHLPDEGIALIEVLAYVADYLSYYQDAVATEAYLSTARQRISVRRHVKLLDYTMHEGCNARVWMALKTSEDQTAPGLDPASIDFTAEGPAVNAASSATTLSIGGDSTDAFQPLLPEQIQLFQSHNLIPFYTWGSSECYLPKGATRATLVDQWKQESATAAPSGSKGQQVESESKLERVLHLRQGDFLLLQEVKGPRTGSSNDADPSHRQVVRLTAVEQIVDQLFDQPLVEIRWAAADALRFPLVISNVGTAPDCSAKDNLSVAAGNIVLADHGLPITNEDLGTVPRKSVTQGCRGVNQPDDLEVVGDRFRPTLSQSPLIYRQPYTRLSAAAAALTQEPRLATPQISLWSIAPLPDGSGPVFQLSELLTLSTLAMRLHTGTDDATAYLRNQLNSRTMSLLMEHGASLSTQAGAASELPGPLVTALESETAKFLTTWQVVPDLLNSLSQDAHFTVEIDDDSVAHLRFGDGSMGRAPDAGSSFFAKYRIGSGSSGNFGAGVINRVAVRGLSSSGITLTAENPLPAQGSISPEEVAKVKLLAPGAYRTDLQRAITAADYATLAERHGGVQRAAATLLWTGTRYEVQVAVDPLGTDQVEPSLLKSVDALLESYRRIGHDVAVVPAVYVPLDLALEVEIAPDYLKAHVKAALLRIFSNGLNDAGEPALFHPDSLTFGTSIYGSRLVAAAQSIEGVVSATITRLRRLFAQPSQEPMVESVLAIGPLEIARLDHDPAHPENGVLRISMRGGR